METAISADGTAIAFDSAGQGPAVVVIGGAFNDRRTWEPLARALGGAGFTGVSYDRRGRGDSGDTAPFAVEREIEDLAAVVDAVGTRPVYAHAISSGAGVLFRALAAGVPVERASVLEPPYRIEGAPPAPPDYIATLQAYVDKDDRAGLVEYFHTKVVGMPVEMLDSMRGTPEYESLLGMAPTLVYDGLAMGGDDQPVPTDLLARVDTPVLAVCSSGTAIPWLAGTAEAVAAALPNGTATRLEGGFHDVPVEVLVPALAEYYRGRP